VRIETPSITKKIGRGVTFLGDHKHFMQVLYPAAVIVSFSVLVAFSKEYFRVPLHIPGHSAIYVIPLMLLGRLACRNRFGGMGIGFLSGSIMAFLGIGGGFLLGIPRYFFMGAVIDLLLWKGGTRGSVIVLVVAGAFANVAKFIVGLVIATLVGLPAFFIQLGMTYSFSTHLAFGAAGGLIAFGVLKAIKQIRKRMRKRSQSTTG
jgi:hypothetical protein